MFETVIKEAEAPDQVFITAEVATLSLPRDRCVCVCAVCVVCGGLYICVYVVWRRRTTHRFPVIVTHPPHTHNRKDWSKVFGSCGVVIFIPDALTDVAAQPDKAMDTTVWPDELGVDGLLTPHAVLSMFERARSDALGVSGCWCVVDMCLYIYIYMHPTISYFMPSYMYMYMKPPHR